MLKKLLATISTLVYFAVTSGIVINMHYCMDRLNSTELYKTKTETCGKCGMNINESNGCCHDEIKIVKLTNDHTISQLSHEIKAPEAGVLTYNNLISDLNIDLFQKINYLNHSPPLLSRQDTYLQNCVFRI
jgi:succinate dehydrogenase/fumarate reductase-like Fe-S protein